jgi:DNA primase
MPSAASFDGAEETRVGHLRQRPLARVRHVGSRIFYRRRGRPPIFDAVKTLIIEKREGRARVGRQCRRLECAVPHHCRALRFPTSRDSVADGRSNPDQPDLAGQVLVARLRHSELKGQEQT